MGTVGAQILPDHETGFGIEMCWRKALDPDRNIEITGDLFMNKMELVGFFPDIDSTCHEVPAVLNLRGRTHKLRRTNVEITKACGSLSEGGLSVFEVL